VVRLDQLSDWCLKRGSPLAEEASKYLEDRQAEFEVKFAEQEKRKKAKKKAADQEPDLDPEEFKHLSRDILTRMLKERLAQEDCNAGAIFDCLESPLWPDAKFALELVAQAAPQQNLQVLLLRFQMEASETDKEDGPREEVCTNYRYARRKEQPKGQGRKEDRQPEADATEAKNKKVKKPAPAAKAGKRGAKGAPAPKEDEEKPAEEVEAEKKLQEEEDKKRQEEEAREQQRPKEYTVAEVEEYQRYADELERFFAELTVRLAGGAAVKEVEAPADGGAPEEAPAEG